MQLRRSSFLKSGRTYAFIGSCRWEPIFFILSLFVSWPLLRRTCSILMCVKCCYICGSTCELEKRKCAKGTLFLWMEQASLKTARVLKQCSFSFNLRLASLAAVYFCFRHLGCPASINKPSLSLRLFFSLYFLKCSALVLKIWRQIIWELQVAPRVAYIIGKI